MRKPTKHLLSIDLVERYGDRRRISYELDAKLRQSDWTELVDTLDRLIMTMNDNALSRLRNEPKDAPGIS